MWLGIRPFLCLMQFLCSGHEIRCRLYGRAWYSAVFVFVKGQGISRRFRKRTIERAGPVGMGQGEGLVWRCWEVWRVCCLAGAPWLVQ